MEISRQFLKLWVGFKLLSTQKFQSKYLVGCDSTNDDDVQSEFYPLGLLPELDVATLGLGKGMKPSGICC